MRASSTPSDLSTGRDALLFEAIANDIATRGYSINPGALAPGLLSQLSAHLHEIPSSKFKRAGVGRAGNHTLNNLVRSDEMCWITGDSAAGKAWLCWAETLQRYLNRHLLLGLFSFESHFAHYGPGDFYTTHQDAFKGEANRILSIVVYLNDNWSRDDGGELVIFTDKGKQNTVKVIPDYGTVVAFLSEDFPHEVLPANRNRYSIAGWFRAHNPDTGHLDPA